tara:strand:- start:13501 stop:13764 length:264 start_codon:yes stop_codon:yes gene_type:complete
MACAHYEQGVVYLCGLELFRLKFLFEIKKKLIMLFSSISLPVCYTILALVGTTGPLALLLLSQRTCITKPKIWVSCRVYSCCFYNDE